MSKKRVLGRGLDDLLAQHDQDLPFLDAYGPSIGETDGLPTSAGIDPVEQLMEAIARLLQAEGHQDSQYIVCEAKENGVHLSVQSGGDKLPLVPSDLGEPDQIVAFTAINRRTALLRGQFVHKWPSSA